MQIPSIQTLREKFEYYPETGKLFRRYKNYSREVGLTLHNARQEVTCHPWKGAKSAVCWALHYGVWPSSILDHADRDPTNNKINNLRPATAQQNSANASLSRLNSVGLKGVSFVKRLDKYSATIKFNRKQIHLGVFDDPQEAAKVYQKKAVELFGEYAAPHG